MTTGPMTPDGHDTDAKLSLQHRQQLSALVDGDLVPDQAGFLLRRLGHDDELRGRWQRWQLIGDVLRGQPVAALPGGADAFAAQVAAAVAHEGRRPGPARRPRWVHVAALAASVAVVAVFVTRLPSGDGGFAGASPEVATAPGPASPEAPATVPAASPAPPEAQPVPEPVREVSVPQFAEATPAPRAARARADTAVAAASRDVAPTPAAPERADAASTLAMAAADPGPAGARPFATPDEPQARPWPRAALPDLARPARAGQFTVGFGDGDDAQAASYGPLPSFYPFEPQLPGTQAMPDAEASPGDPERTP